MGGSDHSGPPLNEVWQGLDDGAQIQYAELAERWNAEGPPPYIKKL
jgi:hypothetical protein